MQKSTFIKSIYFMLILLMPYGITAQSQLAHRVMPDSKVMKAFTNWDFPDSLLCNGQTTFKASQPDVVAVSLNPSELNFVITALPKPIASVLKLRLEVPRSTSAIIEIADQHGQKIDSRPTYLDVGSNQLELTETDWAAEIYLLRVLDKTLNQSPKIIVH